MDFMQVAGDEISIMTIGLRFLVVGGKNLSRSKS